jgi:hypothetical protein
MFSAMKSSPSTITVPQPNVPVPITLDDWACLMRVAVLSHEMTVASAEAPARVTKFLVLAT